MSLPHRRLGEASFSKIEKVSSELFSLTYGAVVTQLLKDYEQVDATNEQLEKMCAASPCARGCPCATRRDSPQPLRAAASRRVL